MPDLAGLAVGFWKDEAQLGAHYHTQHRFEPQMKESRREELYDGWKRALERAKRWAR